MAPASKPSTERGATTTAHDARARSRARSRWRREAAIEDVAQQGDDHELLFQDGQHRADRLNGVEGDRSREGPPTKTWSFSSPIAISVRQHQRREHPVELLSPLGA